MSVTFTIWSILTLICCVTGHKEHREEYCREEHCQPHGHVAGQLHDAGPPEVSFHISSSTLTWNTGTNRNGNNYFVSSGLTTMLV